MNEVQVEVRETLILTDCRLERGDRNIDVIENYVRQ